MYDIWYIYNIFLKISNAFLAANWLLQVKNSWNEKFESKNDYKDSNGHTEQNRKINHTSWMSANQMQNTRSMNNSKLKHF